MSEHTSGRHAAAETQEISCEPAQIYHAAELLGRVPLGQMIDLPDRESLYVQTVVSGETISTVVRHRRTNLEQRREDEYFVVQAETEPPRLGHYIDDLTDENRLIEDGQFDEIMGLRENILNLVPNWTEPAEPREADHLNSLLRGLIER